MIGMIVAVGLAGLVIAASVKLIHERGQRRQAADAEGPATQDEIEAILGREAVSNPDVDLQDVDEAAVVSMLATVTATVAVI
jgi:hypothetical protein